jgi:hypothetical protein
MKKSLLKFMAAAVIAVAGWANTVNAQAAQDEIALVQSIWGLEKRQIVFDYMKFTEAEAAKFTPIYDAFANEQKKLGAERIRLIQEYGANLSTMTNEKADMLVNGIYKNNAAIDKLQLKYYNQIKKELSAMRAAQFIQLEVYLQTMIRAEIQNDLPLIGELDKKAN